jgi:hypothetical protein
MNMDIFSKRTRLRPLPRSFSDVAPYGTYRKVYSHSELWVKKPISGKRSATIHRNLKAASNALERARAYGRRNPTSYQPEVLIHIFVKEVKC